MSEVIVLNNPRTQYLRKSLRDRSGQGARRALRQDKNGFAGLICSQINRPGLIIPRRCKSRKRALSKVKLCVLAVRRCSLSDKQYREGRMKIQLGSGPSDPPEILCLYDLLLKCSYR